jgi:hypothetical protein
VFSPSQKKAFLEEREVYELARLAEPEMTSSILRYFGSAEETCIGGLVCVSNSGIDVTKLHFGRKFFG